MGAVKEETIAQLKDTLQDLPNCMRGFSLSMRSLYAEKAVGGNNQTADDFRKLRDDTRNDAVVYMSGILPITTKFVSNLQDYFENYTALSLDEWKENLVDIIEETDQHKQVAKVLVKLHTDFMVTLKKRQDKANVVLQGMKNLTAEYKKKKEQLEESANTKSDWALGLAFVPFVNVIASPILLASANSDMADAVAKCEEAKIGEAAAFTVEKVLVPAMAQFIKGLESATGFLNILHQELVSMHDGGKKANDEPKKLHYIKMKSKAKDIIQGCRGFYAVIPSVESDLKAIPTEGTDKNYVDHWLKEQKKTIQKEVNAKSIVSGLIKQMKSITA